MRALTVKQPWADLIVAGVKDVENRTWPVPSTLPQWWVCLYCVTRPDQWRRETEWHWHHGRRFEAVEPAPDGPFPFRLAIHAGKQSDKRDGFGRALDTYLSVVGKAGSIQVLTATRPERRGALVGFVTVTGCHHADRCFGVGIPEREGCAPCSPWAEPDAFHWTLTDPVVLDEPVPMRGRQGLWRLPEEFAALDRERADV